MIEMQDRYRDTVRALSERICEAAESIDTDSLGSFVELILSKRKIFIYGSGRSGLVGQYFAVRLVQLGLDVHFVGDMTTPIIGKEDLTILISNTGETMSAVQTANIARRLGSHVVSVTATKNSKLAHASNSVILINLPPSADGNLLPLGTLFEDSAILMFDAIIPELMKRMGQSEDDMRHKHAIWV